MLIKRVIFGLVLILAVAAGWVLLTGMALERTLLSVDYYHKVLEEADGENLQDYFLEAAPAELKSYYLWDESMIYLALVRTAEEKWLKEEAAYAVEQYILFITGEQEELVVKIDLAERRSIFLAELEKELGEHYPELLDELGPQFLELLLSRFDMETEITLIELESRADLDPEFRAELERLERTRTYLRYLPWICFAVLAVAGFLWLGPGGTFIALGLGVLLSGASYYYLWPYGWEAVVVPFVERLTADHGLLEQLWAREGYLIYSFAAEVFNRLALYCAGSGAAVLVFGLFVEGCYRLVRMRSGR